MIMVQSFFCGAGIESRPCIFHIIILSMFRVAKIETWKGLKYHY